MADLNLSEQIATFDRLLPELRQRFGPSWVVIVGEDCKGGFAQFAEAAEFAIANFGANDFLIRHTEAPEPRIPFALVEA